MTKTKHGGPRPGAGRPKKEAGDKKVRITVWPTLAQVRAAGGTATAKALALKAIENK